MRWRPRVRFRLATLLAAITALCVWLGMTVDRAYRQQRGVERVQKLGGAVFFDYQKGPDNPAGRNVPLGGGFDDNAQPRGPQWARNWLGEAYFRKALCVRLWDARLTDDD